MVVNLAASTYANVTAIPDQKRTITLLTSDELKFDKRHHASNRLEARSSALTVNSRSWAHNGHALHWELS